MAVIRLNEEQWEFIQRFIPEQHMGRPRSRDKECFEAMRNIYVKLYPSPKKIVSWRGDEIEIDWLYMLNENFQLARMRRWENDEFHVNTVLDKLQVKY